MCIWNGRCGNGIKDGNETGGWRAAAAAVRLGEVKCQSWYGVLCGVLMQQSAQLLHGLLIAGVQELQPHGPPNCVLTADCLPRSPEHRAADIDCGGLGNPSKCNAGQNCTDAADCDTNNCLNGKCKVRCACCAVQLCALLCWAASTMRPREMPALQGKCQHEKR